MKPLAIDLCCGRGGWTRGLLDAGFTVVGFDIARAPDYPGCLAVQDIRTLSGTQFRHARLIVASPPCLEFSRHGMPWTRSKNPPPPDLSIVEAIWRIRAESGVPTVLENVRASRPWLEPICGPARPFGAAFLYGDYPALLPRYHRAPHRGEGQRMGDKCAMSHDPLRRAVIPFELAAVIGRVFL